MSPTPPSGYGGWPGLGRMTLMASSLLVISDREPLAWLLSERRWAIPRERLRSSPPVGHELLLYTTRGCYRNPGRDRGLVMGHAVVSSPPGTLEAPVSFRGRDFTIGFDVEVTGVARVHDGVELGPLAGRLDFLPDPSTWSVRLRRSLVPLGDNDARELATRIQPLLGSLDERAADYVTAAKINPSRV